MTLRIMLVGLVASLGLELPSGPEVSRWTISGRDWVQARLADLSGPVVEADRPDAELTDCPQAETLATIEPTTCPVEMKVSDDNDAAFLAASGAMAADFAADLMTMQVEPQSGEPSAIELADDAEPCCLMAVGEADRDDASSEDAPAEVMTETDDVPSRADRVSAAIRLTREAVQAWADLMEEAADEASPAY